MRISATSANPALRDTPVVRRSGAGGFSVSDGTGTTARAAAGHLQAVAGVDVLVALQGLDDPAERRRRAVRGGRAALDALDELKLGLLSGSLDRTALNRLRAAASELTKAIGDERLDPVLAEIDLRLQVEIAKLSRR